MPKGTGRPYKHKPNYQAEKKARTSAAKSASLATGKKPDKAAIAKASEKNYKRKK